MDALHFDEAWYAYAAFHEFYAGRHAMGVPRGHARRPHAGLCHALDAQAAGRVLAGPMIHIQESEKRKIDTTRFNDAFMMHGSTSPHYGIIASLDVSSAMMDGLAGRAIVQETHDEAMSFAARWPPRRQLRKADWWFRSGSPMGWTWASRRRRPTGCSTPRPVARFRQARRRLRDARPDQGHAAHAGHGQGRQKLGKSGIPAAVVSKYLWSAVWWSRRPACTAS